jgi:hypothetical protein
MWRRTLVVALAVSVIAGFLLTLCLASARLNSNRYARIKGIMTEAQVKAILGPPGDSRTLPDVYTGVFEGEDLLLGLPSSKLPQPPSEGKEVWWKSDDDWIAVQFNSAGMATYKFRELQKNSFVRRLQRLKHWLLQWLP